MTFGHSGACTGLSTGMPECQKLKMTGEACMAKRNNLRSWALNAINAIVGNMYAERYSLL